MEYVLDFSAHLPQHLTPSYDKVVTLLNQTVTSWVKGSAMLTRGQKGVYIIKVWDKLKGEALLGKSVDFYYEGDKSKKKVQVFIQEKPKFHKYNNPRYVTMIGFSNSPADKIENSQIDKVLENFGDIIIPTDDVYADIFLTGKKKARVDLKEGKNIPRDLFVEFTSDDGIKRSISVRCFYRDQPYLCKTCKVKHIGDCPEWTKKKYEREQSKKEKEEKVRTAMIGDSNFRCVNEAGVMATVTAISGARIGNLANQIKFQNTQNTDNLILHAGGNCANDMEDIGKESWEKRTQIEITQLEGVMNTLMNEGKHFYILDVPPTPALTSNDKKKAARKYLNEALDGLVKRVNGKHMKGKAVFVKENDGNYNASTDFIDDKHLSQLAVEKLVSRVSEYLPSSQKLKNESLSEKSTGEPYKGCYGTYPLGCKYCTALGHQMERCPAATGKNSGKRNLSTGSQQQQQPAKQKK